MHSTKVGRKPKAKSASVEKKRVRRGAASGTGFTPKRLGERAKELDDPRVTESLRALRPEFKEMSDDVLEPPAWFDDEMRGKWNHLVKQLVQANMVAEVDYDALVTYVSVWIKWMKAEQSIKDDGVILTRITDRGAEIQTTNPAFLVAIKCIGELRRLTYEFGFTPAARMKMGLSAKRRLDNDKKQSTSKKIFG